MDKGRFEPFKGKLLGILAKRGIKFKESDEFNNVVFYSDSYEKRIRHCEFYRENGIYSYKVDLKGTEFKLEPMLDEMFYMGWMRSIIEYCFKDK